MERMRLQNIHTSVLIEALSDYRLRNITVIKNCKDKPQFSSLAKRKYQEIEGADEIIRFMLDTDRDPLYMVAMNEVQENDT